MTKTRKTNGLKVLTLLMMVATFLMLFCSFGATTTSASAATTPKYSLYYDYTYYRGFYLSNCNTEEGTGTNVLTSCDLTLDVGKTNLTMQIYGSSSSGTGTLSKGGYIGSSTVTVVANCTYDSHSITIANSSGTTVASSSAKTCTVSSLSDGYYTITYEGGSEWKEDGNIRDHPRATRIVATSAFTVDTTAPTISGASTSSTGKYTNSAFTVTASDSRSGVAKLYWRDPSSSSYSVLSSSTKSVVAGSLNGLYRFYAVDNVGNTSTTYYVYYDNVVPVGNIKGENGTLSLGVYTNKTFSYSATDSGCGISKLEYKTPSSSSWQTYTSGTLIPTSSTNGKYSFRALDKAGNYSAEQYVYLDTTKPVGTLYGGTSAVSSGGQTKANYIKFLGSDTLSGVKSTYVKMPSASTYTSYTSGSQLTEDGTYTFYCTDNAGNTSISYTITLDTTEPTLSCSLGSFYETTGNSFVVSATDSSAVSLYYKTPSMSSYALASGSSYNVSNTEEDGKYYFYASDSLGNTTSTVWVELSVEVPVFNVIKSSSDNSRYITWDGNYAVTVNGSTYTKNSWLRSEGQYTVVATNTYGRSTTKVFTIDHYYVAGDKTAPSCTGDGFTTYIWERIMHSTLRKSIRRNLPITRQLFLNIQEKKMQYILRKSRQPCLNFLLRLILTRKIW